MAIEQLWTASDETHLASFRAGLETEDLARALFAIEGASEGAARGAVLTMDAWSASVRARLPEGATAEQQTRALRDTFVEAGLTGDSLTYAASKNSMLSAVIAGRRGLPILVSAVWMLVGQRAGLVVEGVGLPGHFIARVGGAEGVLVDPFHQGQTLSRADVEALVRRNAGATATFSEDSLRAVGTRDLLLRVVRNLLSSLAREQDGVRLHRLTAFWAALSPDTPEPLSQRARLAEQLGALAVSREAYEEIARRFPETQDGRVAQHALGRLGRQSVWN